MTPLLEVETLTKAFSVRGADGSHEELIAVNDVSFTIESGTSMAVVGESGSGKTTIARIVAGLETPSSGVVRICGEERPRRGSARRTRRRFARLVQMVFQDPYSSQDPSQTIRGSIEEVLREHFDLDGRQRRERVTQLLDQVGLDGRQGAAYPRALSGGQRQRAAIARALAAQPRLLILDEAVSALDVSVQAQVINLLNDIRAELDIGYLFVSHDLAVVRQVSERCVVMHHGRAVESGSTAAILDTPQDPYTNDLIAAIPRPGWHPVRRSAQLTEQTIAQAG